MKSRLLFWRVAIALATTLAASAAIGQSYPNRSIRWVLGFPAGGANDFIARTVGAGLSQQLGQPVVIDNKAGASGIIAAELVAKSPADGYTIFTFENGIAVNNAGLYKKLSYQPLKDFDPIGMMVRFPMLVAAHSASRFDSAKELVDEIRKKPGSVNYATPGIGTPHNLAMEMLKDSAHLDATPIHYKGGAPGLQDTLGGQVELILTDFTTAGPMFKTGKLKPLGIFSKGGIAALPGVPSFFDLGYASVETFAWQGMVVPAGTPGAVKARLGEALQRALESHEVRSKLLEAGLDVTPSSAADMLKFIEKEAAYWLPLIKQKNLSMEGS